MIRVIVGSQEKRFAVYKELLCEHSEFCRAACGREWKEGQEDTIYLPEARPDAFNLYIHWLYTGTVDTTLMTEPEVPPGTVARHPAHSNLAKVFVLGNFLGDIAFCNCLIDCILQKLDKGGIPPSPQTLSYVWRQTSKGSRFQLLFFDLFAALVNHTIFETKLTQYPPDLVVDLAIRFVRGGGRMCPKFKDRCRYHTHKEGEETCP